MNSITYNDGCIVEVNGGFIFVKNGVSNGPFVDVETLKEKFPAKEQTAKPITRKSKRGSK